MLSEQLKIEIFFIATYCFLLKPQVLLKLLFAVSDIQKKS